MGVGQEVFVNSLSQTVNWSPGGPIPTINDHKLGDM